MAGVLVAVLTGVLVTWGQDFFGALFTGGGASGQEQGERVASPDPLAVLDIQDVTMAGDYLLPPDTSSVAAAELEADPTGRTMADEWNAWRDRHRAIPVEVAKWDITLEGRRTNEINIVNMKPVLVGGRCQANARGVLLESTGAGSDEKIPLRVDIDKPTPVLLAVDEKTGEPTHPFFDSKKITLKKNEKSVVVLEAHSSALCEWTLEVDVIADGRRTSMTIAGPGGRPFALTGRLDYAEYESVYLSPIHCSKHIWERVTGEQAEQILTGAVTC